MNYLDAGAIIRYEVIYKNLLRDLRKFYSCHFAETIPQPKQKDPNSLQKVLQAYAVCIFGKATLERFGVSKHEVGFCLGSLIKPKQMLQLKSLDSANDKVKIMNIYFYLYKFSLQRLQSMLDSKPMALILAYYIQQSGQERIQRSPIMMKYELAYYEAQKVLIKSNCLSDVLPFEFNLNKILETELPKLDNKDSYPMTHSISTY